MKRVQVHVLRGLGALKGPGTQGLPLSPLPHTSNRSLEEEVEKGGERGRRERKVGEGGEAEEKEGKGEEEKREGRRRRERRRRNAEDIPAPPLQVSTPESLETPAERAKGSQCA